MDCASTGTYNIIRQNIALELPSKSSKTVLVNVCVSFNCEETTHSWQFDWRSTYFPPTQFHKSYYKFSLSALSLRPSYNFKYGKSFYVIAIRNAKNESSVEETKDLAAPNYNQFEFTKDNAFIAVNLDATIMISIILQSYTTDRPPQSAFKSMLDSGNLTDVVIKTKSGNFPCHKFVLASASEYFEKMFSIDMKEKKESVVDWIGVFEADVVRDLLHYLYTGQTPPHFPSTCMELMKVAHMCLIDRLKTLCGRRLKETLTLENMGEMLGVAAKYEAEELQEAAVNFIVKHYDSKKHSPAPWQMVEPEFGKNLATTIIKALVAQNIFI